MCLQAVLWTHVKTLSLRKHKCFSVKNLAYSLFMVRKEIQISEWSRSSKTNIDCLFELTREPDVGGYVGKFLTELLSFRGLSPAEAEFNYLNTARTLELYGVELHYARVSLDELVL